MRSCREISELVSKSMDKKLELSERLAIKFHLMICSHCRHFRGQTQFMRKAALRYAEHLQNRSSNKS